MEKSQLSKLAQASKGVTGVFITGKIEGVDLTKSGKMENGQTYGSSVKLKFAQKTEIMKDVGGGVMMPTTAFRTQTIKISVPDSELAEKVSHFNKYLGKEYILQLDIPDNASFKVVDYQEVA